MSRSWAGWFPSPATKVPILQVSDGRGMVLRNGQCRGEWLAPRLGSRKDGGAGLGTPYRNYGDVTG